ncbi:MAG: PHP-associated domain-containing protein [Candidatus Woesearchaeota archaeon]
MIAITDHNKFSNIKGTIPGEEVKTKQGEVVALYISEQIKPWQNIESALDEIKAKGGISVLAHPLDKVRPDAIKQLSKEILNQVDYLEINGRSFNSNVIEVISIAKKYKKELVLGSDSHLPWELGKHYFYTTKFSKEELLDNPKNFRKAVTLANKQQNFVISKNDAFKLANELFSSILHRSRRLKNKLFRK